MITDRTRNKWLEEVDRDLPDVLKALRAAGYRIEKVKHSKTTHTTPSYRRTVRLKKPGFSAEHYEHVVICTDITGRSTPWGEHYLVLRIEQLRYGSYEKTRQYRFPLTAKKIDKIVEVVGLRFDEAAEHEAARVNSQAAEAKRRFSKQICDRLEARGSDFPRGSIYYRTVSDPERVRLELMTEPITEPEACTLIAALLAWGIRKETDDE